MLLWRTAAFRLEISTSQNPTEIFLLFFVFSVTSALVACSEWMKRRNKKRGKMTLGVSFSTVKHLLNARRLFILAFRITFYFCQSLLCCLPLSLSLPFFSCKKTKQKKTALVAGSSFDTPKSKQGWNRGLKAVWHTLWWFWVHVLPFKTIRVLQYVSLSIPSVCLCLNTTFQVVYLIVCVSSFLVSISFLPMV